MSDKNQATAEIEMPRYQCIKKVWALKIAVIKIYEDGRAKITPADPTYLPFTIPSGWFETKFEGSEDDPGYYVQYEGGYESWSPTEAFEKGYIRIGWTSPQR
jgi:hypothetical protein